MNSKSTKELVAEIHNDFYSAEERLLNEAKRIVSRPHDELKQKGERLSRLGFGASKPANIARAVQTNYTQSQELIGSIAHFRQHYPSNKFITEAEVKRICHKYKLVFGNATNYIGDIPEKNLLEIESFKLKKQDWMEKPSSGWLGFLSTDTIVYDSAMRRLLGMADSRPSEITKPEKAEAEKEQPAFKIVAPITDFNTSDTSVKDGYRLEINIPDPIVLQPVKGGYLIVTAWGEESSDEAVVNENMN